MWDDCDFDADALDDDRRLAQADRLVSEVKAGVDSLDDALELDRAARLIRGVKARLAERHRASVA